MLSIARSWWTYRLLVVALHSWPKCNSGPLGQCWTGKQVGAGWADLQEINAAANIKSITSSSSFTVTGASETVSNPISIPTTTWPLGIRCIFTWPAESLVAGLQNVLDVNVRHVFLWEPTVFAPGKVELLDTSGLANQGIHFQQVFNCSQGFAWGWPRAYEKQGAHAQQSSINWCLCQKESMCCW